MHCSSKQIHREFNSPADKLANEDVRGFLAEMAPVVPDGRFIRLRAPAAAADLSGLIAWTASLSVSPRRPWTGADDSFEDSIRWDDAG